MPSFERPLSRDLGAAVNWRLLAGSRRWTLLPESDPLRCFVTGRFQEPNRDTRPSLFADRGVIRVGPLHSLDVTHVGHFVFRVASYSDRLRRGVSSCTKGIV